MAIWPLKCNICGKEINVRSYWFNYYSREALLYVKCSFHELRHNRKYIKLTIKRVLIFLVAVLIDVIRDVLKIVTFPFRVLNEILE